MAINATIKGVIFDLDRTILNLPIDYASLRRDLSLLASDYGASSNFSHILEEMERVSSHLGKRSKDFVDHCYGIIDKHELKAASHAVPVKGSPQLILQLESEGYKLAIASRNSLRCVEASLAHTGMLQHFHTLVGRESTQKTKPEAAPLLYCLERMALHPEEAIFVGDHRYDAVASSRAGIRFVLLGTTPDQDFPPHERIEKLEELIGLIRNPA